MKVGVIGLGKLGYPWAVAVKNKGHDVIGYDPVSPKDSKIPLKTITEIVAESELIFVIIQTPHKPELEGTMRLTDERADFDYTYLKQGIKDIAEEAKRQQRRTVLVVVSTCLPGTFEREIKPLLNGWVDYLYSPSFTATGTVARDLYNAEFNLIGDGEKERPDRLSRATKLEDFYSTINSAECIKTDITTAEAIKVSYNTFVTMKTVLANTWGEIAYKMNLRYRDIHKAWSLSTTRLLSESYLKPGMSDGGACHPRDNIAMSWFAREIDLSHDLFGDLMRAREDYENWHADLAIETCKKYDLPLIILGKGFKPESDIQSGSAAILLANLLLEKKFPFEHYEDLQDLPQAVYFIATDHKRYGDYKFPPGCIIINPSDGNNS